MGGASGDDVVSSLRSRRRRSSAALGSPSSGSASSDLSLSSLCGAEVESAGCDRAVAPPADSAAVAPSAGAASEAAAAPEDALDSGLAPSERGGLSVATVLR